MSPAALRVEVLSPTLTEVTAHPSELGVLTNYLSDRGLLSMRQSDCVVVEGCWRTVLAVLSGFDGDPWLSNTPGEEVGVEDDIALMV